MENTCNACGLDESQECRVEPSRVRQFDDALRGLTDERGKFYGHPLDDFSRAAAIKAAVATCPDPEIRHVLEMIAVKMSRLTETPDHTDSLFDIAGYARTGCMVLDERDRRQYELEV